MREKRTNIFVFLLVLTFIFSFSFASAATNLDDLHLNIQTVDGSGKVITGTFNFEFNISTSNTCTPVVYTDSANLATDSRGIVSYYLSNVNLDYLNQYYLCYYRDGSLIETSEIARSPYAFRAKYVDLGGVEVTQNFDLGIYNMSAANFFGDGSGLTNLNVSNIDLSNYYTSAQINGFGYYNLSNFDINDYYLNSNPNNYLNETTLNLSSTNYWGKNGNDLYYNSGNVGIGTSSPGAKLEVNSGTNDGYIKIKTTGTNSGYYIENIASIWRLYATGDGAISIRDNTNSKTPFTIFPNSISSALLLTSTGIIINNQNLLSDFRIKGISDDSLLFADGSKDYVGIGTSTPSQKLDVNGSAIIRGILDLNNNKITNLANGTAAQDAATYAQIQALSGNVSGNFVPYNGATQNVNLGNNNLSVGGNDLFVDNNNGRVGIGTSSPDEKLEVNGNIQLSPNSYIAAIGLPSSGQGGYFQGTGEAGSNAGYGAWVNYNSYWNGTNWLQPRGSLGTNMFSSNYHLGWTFRTAAAGSVNDGIITPLEVAKISTSGSLQLDGSLNVDGAGNSYIMGNVGIGTTTPQNKLNVIGDGNFTGNLYSNGIQVLTGLNDTLQTVTDRGATTTNRIDIYHNGNYVDSALRLTRGVQGTGNDPSMPVTYGYPYLEIGGQEWFANGLYTIGFGWDNGNKQAIELGMKTTDTAGNVAGDFIIATRTNAADADISEKLRLTAAGDLGIGTISPSQKLDVNGSAIIRGILDLNNNKITNLANGTAAQDAATYGQIQALSGNVSGNYVPYNGADQNVNLGNNEVLASNYKAYHFTRSIPTTVNNYVGIGNLSISNGAHNIYLTITVPSSAFSVSKTYLLPVLYDQTSGTWQKALPIADTGAYSGNNFEVDVNSDATKFSIRIRRTSGTISGTANIHIYQTGSISESFVEDSSTGSTSEPSVIFSSTPLTAAAGKVGIGTTSPIGKLQVGDNSLSDQFLTFQTSNSNERGINYYLADGTNIRGWIKWDSNEDLLLRGDEINLGVNGVPNALIVKESTGKVGIGTISPSQKLEVVGNINVTQNITISGMTIYKDTSGDMVFRA